MSIRYLLLGFASATFVLSMAPAYGDDHKWLYPGLSNCAAVLRDIREDTTPVSHFIYLSWETGYKRGIIDSIPGPLENVGNETMFETALTVCQQHPDYTFVQASRAAVKMINDR